MRYELSACVECKKGPRRRARRDRQMNGTDRQCTCDNVSYTKCVLAHRSVVCRHEYARTSICPRVRARLCVRACERVPVPPLDLLPGQWTVSVRRMLAQTRASHSWTESDRPTQIGSRERVERKKRGGRGNANNYGSPQSR
jgi:hypothetical protein